MTLLDITFDAQTLLLAGALMGVFVSIRPFAKAVRDVLRDLVDFLRWVRRNTLDEIYTRLHHVERQLDEHESDVELHTIHSAKQREERQ